jgi:hypothetical protein
MGKRTLITAFGLLVTIVCLIWLIFYTPSTRLTYVALVVAFFGAMTATILSIRKINPAVKMALEGGTIALAVMLGLMQVLPGDLNTKQSFPPDTHAPTPTPPSSDKEAGVEFQLYPDDDIYVFVPRSAPIRDLLNKRLSSGCTERELRWLAKYGTQRQNVYVVGVRNTNTSGPEVTVSDPVVTKVKRETMRSGFLFHCVSQGAGDGTLARIDLDKGERRARRIDWNTNKVLGRVVFNLAPGEEVTLELHVIGEMKSYTGDLYVMVKTSQGTVPRMISMPNSGKFHTLGMGTTSPLIVEPDTTAVNGYRCTKSGVPRQCDLSDIERSIESGSSRR